MRKGLGAALMLIVPSLGLAAMIQLGDRSWRACFTPDRPWSFALDDALWLTALSAPGFLPFALVHLLAPSQAVRRWNLMALGLMIAVSAYMLLPPSALHDCDRKGTTGAFYLIITLPLALMIALFTQLTRLALNAGKPLHDP